MRNQIMQDEGNFKSKLRSKRAKFNFNFRKKLVNRRAMYKTTAATVAVSESETAAAAAAAATEGEGFEGGADGGFSGGSDGDADLADFWVKFRGMRQRLESDADAADQVTVNRGHGNCRIDL